MKVNLNNHLIDFKNPPNSRKLVFNYQNFYL